MKRLKSSQLTVVITSGLVILLIGIMIGYSLTPMYQLDKSGEAHEDLGPPDRWLDQRYLRAMIAHHRAAMLLAQQVVTTSERPEIVLLAEEILNTEPALIAELMEWKQEWYGDYVPVLDPQVDNLGSYDNNFDLRFLNALIRHHDDGLAMTAEVRSKSTRAQVLDNADEVEAFLRSTLPVLKGWRNDWYFSSESEETL